MSLSRHAQTRAQQRRIPPMLIDLLMQFGATEKAGDGTAKFFFDKPSRKRLRAYAGPLASVLDEHMDIYIVVAPDDRVVTVAHRLDRIHRH